MVHKHHIIPKYKGGPDSPDNLIEVSTTCHAMFHFCNWQLWGEKRDWLAWKGLTKMIGKGDIITELIKEGKGVEAMNKRKAELRATDPNWAEKERQMGIRLAELGRVAALSPKAREKRKETMRRNNHAKGESNSQYGTMWITNGESNSKIKVGDPIPENYWKGRKV